MSNETNEQQQTISMDDIIARAKKASEKQNNQSNDYTKTETEYETIEWQGLEDKSFNIVHPVGRFHEQRSEPWHSKFVLYSKILIDSGYKVPFYWPYATDEWNIPTPNVDSNFILYRMYKAISKGCKDYKETYPETGDYADTDVFKRVMWNKTQAEIEGKGKNYKNQFLGKARVLIPVWDESDDWCKANNKTKILTTKKVLSESNGKTYDNSDIGITLSLYNSILTEIADYNDGSWDTDFAIEKDAENKDIAKKYVIHRVSDPAVVKKIQASIGRTPSTNILDPQFVANLKHHDLDKIGNVWSYRAIYKHFLNLAKEIDGICHTSFAQELAELKDTEEAEWKAKQSEQNKTVSPVSEEAHKAAITSEEKVEPVEQNSQKAQSKTPVSRGVKKEQTKEEVLSICKEIYPHWNDLSEEEKSITVSGYKSITKEGKVTIEEGQEDSFVECPECLSKKGISVMTSIEVSTCHNCGVKFE